MNSKHVNCRKEMRGVVKAEMFGQLTSGLESAWNKLKGEGFFFLSLKKKKKKDFVFILSFCCDSSEVLTKENIVEPMRDIRRALLEADVS